LHGPPQIGFNFNLLEDTWEKQRKVVEGSWSEVPMRDPELPALGTEDESAHPIYHKVISLANDTLTHLGPGCWERVYHLGIYESAWFSENNIDVQMERVIKLNHMKKPGFGRVDLQVGGCYVFELKTTTPTEFNIKVDTLQIERYLHAYAFNNHTVHRAAILYLTPKGVIVVEAYCHWVFRELSLE